MKIHDNEAYTPYGVFEASRDNMYMVKKQVISFFVLSEKHDKPAQKMPKQAEKIMFSLIKKKKWGRLGTIGRPKPKHPKEPRQDAKKKEKNISLSSEKTLQQFKADDPSIFQTTVKELHESKTAVAEKLSDPLKKVIPIALIFGGVMGLMIVMSNAPMVIDKVAEVLGITPPKIVYLTPNEAAELGLDVANLPLAPLDDVSRDQWCKNNPKECRLQGEALLEKQNNLALSMFGKKMRALSDSQVEEVTALCNLTSCGEPAPADEDTIIDTEIPALTMPADIVEYSDTRGAVQVSYVVIATDNSGEVDLVCEPKSRSIFPVGITMVKCTAMDPSGNIAMGEFMITVIGEESEIGIVPEFTDILP
jgi:hypothetical protein